MNDADGLDFSEGRDAFDRGLTLSDCPHSGYTRARLSWMAGWIDAHRHAILQRRAVYDVTPVTYAY